MNFFAGTTGFEPMPSALQADAQPPTYAISPILLVEDESNIRFHVLYS